MPLNEAAALSCVMESAVPALTAAGVAQVMVGVALLTLSSTLPVVVVKPVPSAGVKVTVRLWPAPALSSAPAAGV